MGPKGTIPPELVRLIVRLGDDDGVEEGGEVVFEVNLADWECKSERFGYELE